MPNLGLRNASKMPCQLQQGARQAPGWYKRNESNFKGSRILEIKKEGNKPFGLLPKINALTIKVIIFNEYYKFSSIYLV